MSNNELEQEDEDLEISEYEELLYSPFSDLRLFNFAAASPVLGIMLQETEDSFLVGLPTRLNKQKDSEVLKLEELLPFPYIRLFKSNVLYISPLFKIFEFAYIKYLKEIGLPNNPEMIDFLPDDFLEANEIEVFYDDPEIPLDEELEERLALAANAAGIVSTNRSVH